MLHPHSLQSLLFSLFSILSVDNVLVSINLIFFSYLCLLRYFGYTRLFLSPSHAISNNIFFSQFPHLHLISRFVLSLFCRISSRCTNRTQSIHPPPYLVPLLRVSIPTTTLDSDPPISQRYYPYRILFLVLSLFVLSAFLARVQFRTSLSLIYEKLRKTEID